jgi:glycosyltransferase involved in cell wall biosynthesis
VKILHIITRLILGGAQQNTVLCCAAQVAAGHQVTLAYGPIYGPEGSVLPDAQKSGANLREIHSLRRAILPLHDLAAYYALRRLIRQERPDVVHTHSSKAGILGRAAAWAEQTPAVIHTIHGLPFHSRHSQLVYQAYVLVERWAAPRCHRLIGITNAMCEAFQEHKIGRPGQFEVVPSAVDISQFQYPAGERERVRHSLGIPDHAPVVGLVARFDPYKGQDDLLNILPGLIAQHPQTRLLFVGDGWNRKHLEERVAREGFSAHVIFTGLVPPERVGPLMSAMDIHALPSYQEGQARTLVQALLCDCAIVGYAVGGIPEVCIDGQTGRLAPQGDQKALQQAILDLLAHPEERKRLAAQGKLHAQKNFDHRIMIRRVEEIYRAVLKENGKRAR